MIQLHRADLNFLLIFYTVVVGITSPQKTAALVRQAAALCGSQTGSDAGLWPAVSQGCCG